MFIQSIRSIQQIIQLNRHICLKRHFPNSAINHSNSHKTPKPKRLVPQNYITSHKDKLQAKLPIQFRLYSSRFTVQSVRKTKMAARSLTWQRSAPLFPAQSEPIWRKSLLAVIRDRYSSAIALPICFVGDAWTDSLFWEYLWHTVTESLFIPI